MKKVIKTIEIFLLKKGTLKIIKRRIYKKEKKKKKKKT